MMPRPRPFLLIGLLAATAWPLRAAETAPAAAIPSRITTVLQLLADHHLLPEAEHDPVATLKHALSLAAFPEGVLACLDSGADAPAPPPPTLDLLFRGTPCAYLRVTTLAADQVTALLEQLARAPTRGWLVDLRDCRSLEPGQAARVAAALPAEQPCVVLINRLTVGEAEELAARLSQREHALCMGEASAGLRAGARRLPLPGGFSVPVPLAGRTPLWQPLVPEAPLPPETAGLPDAEADSWVNRAFVMLRVIMASGR